MPENRVTGWHGGIHGGPVAHVKFQDMNRHGRDLRGYFGQPFAPPPADNRGENRRRQGPPAVARPMPDDAPVMNAMGISRF